MGQRWWPKIKRVGEQRVSMKSAVSSGSETMEPTCTWASGPGRYGIQTCFCSHPHLAGGETQLSVFFCSCKFSSRFSFKKVDLGHIAEANRVSKHSLEICMFEVEGLYCQLGKGDGRGRREESRPLNRSIWQAPDILMPGSGFW
jgi:hypothetical protein